MMGIETGARDYFSQAKDLNDPNLPTMQATESVDLGIPSRTRISRRSAASKRAWASRKKMAKAKAENVSRRSGDSSTE